MIKRPPFERSVFINCPFDPEYKPLLLAMAFCVADRGLVPRIAPENGNNVASRLDRIIELVRGSRFGIHDISRCKAATAGQFARMNMPFELGIDHGCYTYGGKRFKDKAILILEERQKDYL